MAASWVLSLPPGVEASDGEGGELIFSGPTSRTVLRGLSPALGDALRRLRPGDAESRLAESILTAEGPDALARWYYFLQHLARRGCLVASVHADRERLATLVPIAPSFVFNVTGPAPERPCRLSRFACLHRDGDDTVLESPLAFARVVLHDDRAAALVHTLARPTNARELGRRVLGLKAAAAAQLLGLFTTAGMVVEVGDDGEADEDRNPALQTWEFHDLLFHSRSRVGRHDSSVGGTYRHAGRLEPPPPFKPATTLGGAETVELYRPDLERLEREDPPFARVLEQRCSIREYGVQPIGDRQLGEFLFRVARVKSRREWEAATPNGPIRVESTTRPYPAGGGLYELEIYAVVHVCGNLPSGLYHYDAAGHRLERLAGRTAAVEALLTDAAQSAGMAADAPQVLLILASRFPRLAWKYASLAYALTLKHVGVVYQTMYLAATAMGLAPCALGGGDSDLFARASGVDYYAETSVGEFLLGSRPPHPTLSPIPWGRG
jgi:oxazoline/thiazoline dehydrogenase